LALLWNAMGAFDYLATQLKLDFYMSQFSEEQLAYFYGFPAWAVAGWAFGVWGALAGAVGLLLRRRWAVWAFAVSLAGLAVSSIYTLVLSNGAEVMGSEGAVFSAIIWAVAIFLLGYARALAKRSVMR
jgi:ribose/xylose/arabinose/galactoside ABC-type transport system permease subunit